MSLAGGSGCFKDTFSPWIQESLTTNDGTAAVASSHSLSLSSSTAAVSNNNEAPEPLRRTLKMGAPKPRCST